MAKQAAATVGATDPLMLPDVLDIRACAPLHEALLGRRGAELVIDGSKVQRLGAQCLQVLLSAIATWKADNLDLAIISPSPDLIEGLELLGVLRAEPQEQAA